jgi:hypothetical protein
MQKTLMRQYTGVIGLAAENLRKQRRRLVVLA